MSTEIDWSKAPEGAEFARVTIGGVDFYKTIAGVFSYLSKDGKWHPAVTQRGDRDLIARPAAPTWAGEVHPPVGTVCECQRPGDIWQKVTILAHYNGHAWVTGDGKHCFTVPTHWKLRPIKTAEQVEAEEREKAILEMVSGPLSGRISSWESAEALYDAGYRKVEGGEK